MHLSLPRPFRRRRHASRGQSLVELALVVPVLLLLTLTAIDFGRVFLGWVNVQQMTRIAADHAAEHATAWGSPGNSAERDRYQKKVLNDARAINCELPDTDGDGSPDVPLPQISGTQLGASVSVQIDCEFSIITPVISDLVGGTVLVSAQTTYPVKEGAVATVPGGGTPIQPLPNADFVGSPQTGWGSSTDATEALEVTFLDLSTGGPASWAWDFNVGTPGGSGTPGTVTPSTSLTRGPHTVTYDCTGTPGDTCTYGVSLRVSNAGGSDTVSRSGYITVTVPPDTGPIAEFTGSPRSGISPLNVNFQFVDVRAGAVVYTTYEWDLDGDGAFDDGTGQTASYNYTVEGSYDVSLRVSDGTTTNSVTKTAYINVLRKICTVPDFFNRNRNQAQARWDDAGFTTQVQFAAGNWNMIRTQSLVGGTIDPQPDGCDSIITVGP